LTIFVETTFVLRAPFDASARAASLIVESDSPWIVAYEAFFAGAASTASSFASDLLFASGFACSLFAELERPRGSAGAEYLRL
jgi:hypothetical protein